MSYQGCHLSSHRPPSHSLLDQGDYPHWLWHCTDSTDHIKGFQHISEDQSLSQPETVFRLAVISVGIRSMRMVCSDIYFQYTVHHACPLGLLLWTLNFKQSGFVRLSVCLSSVCPVKKKIEISRFTGFNPKVKLEHTQKSASVYPIATKAVMMSSPSPTNEAQDLHENLLSIGDAAFPGLSNQNELNWTELKALRFCTFSSSSY